MKTTNEIIQEVDVYLAYGRTAQAKEMLEAAINAAPNDQLLQQKLNALSDAKTKQTGQLGTNQLFLLFIACALFGMFNGWYWLIIAATLLALGGNEIASRIQQKNIKTKSELRELRQEAEKMQAKNK